MLPGIYIRPKNNLALTGLGRTKLETTNIVGAEATIMWHIKEKGEATPSEIHQANPSLPIPRIKGIAKSLVMRGWLEWV